MKMPKPGDAHGKLERLVGVWEGSETLHPSPWDPVGGPATGRVENRRALDGFAVVQDYEQERNGAVTYRGHGIFFWDPRRREYAMHWWDSMGSPPNIFVGDFDGESLVLVYRGEQGHHRVTTDLGTKDGYTFRMDVSGDGEAWTTFMEGEYRRQS